MKKAMQFVSSPTAKRNGAITRFAGKKVLPKLLTLPVVLIIFSVEVDGLEFR